MNCSLHILCQFIFWRHIAFLRKKYTLSPSHQSQMMVHLPLLHRCGFYEYTQVALSFKTNNRKTHTVVSILQCSDIFRYMDWLIDYWLIDWCFTTTLAIFHLYRGVNNIVINLVFRYKQHIVKRSCLQCEDCSKKFADKHSDCNHASFQMFCLVFSFKTILDYLYGYLLYQLQSHWNRHF